MTRVGLEPTRTYAHEKEVTTLESHALTARPSCLEGAAGLETREAELIGEQRRSCTRKENGSDVGRWQRPRKAVPPESHELCGNHDIQSVQLFSGRFFVLSFRRRCLLLLTLELPVVLSFLSVTFRIVSIAI